MRLRVEAGGSVDAWAREPAARKARADDSIGISVNEG
jgi:hypothetical protein